MKMNDNKNKKEDLINSPSHYIYGKYECVDILDELLKDKSGKEGYLFGNMFKYLWRYKRKNGVEDLRKAKRYLEKLIESLS